MDHYSSQFIIKELHALYQQASERQLGKTLEMDETLRIRALEILGRNPEMQSLPEEKEVTILLSDLRGFTSLSEHYSPLEIIDLLNRYFTVMSRVINHFGGTIDKFMGDAILVVFGTQEAGNSDIVSALSCAVVMQIELDKMNQENHELGYPPMYMGIGINTGVVVAGNLGSDVYNEFTVIGDHVNLAARIESYTLRGQILLSEYTYARAKNRIETGQRNVLTFKGKEHPITTYELLAVNTPQQRLIVPRREERKSPRVAVDMPLSFQQIDGKSVSDEYLEGTIIDLSYGGMYVASSHVLPPYSDIRFPLALSLSSHQRDDVYAKVLRTNPIGNNEFHYHLEFTHISQDSQAALKAFIDRMIAPEPAL